MHNEKFVLLTLERRSMGKIPVRYGYGFSEHKLHLLQGEFSMDTVPTILCPISSPVNRGLSRDSLLSYSLIRGLLVFV